MSLRVLLVDDVAAIRQVVRVALRMREGFDVVGEAGDGSEAVAMAERLRPDIVVLDLGLPDLAGRDVLTQIQARSPGSKVVVFAGAEASDHEWIADRVEEFVLKDASLDYLIDLLESVGQRPARQAILPLLDEPASVSRAREFVRGALHGWGVAQLSDDALLVVSELVANAITHAQSPCELRVSTSPTSVRIEVTDEGEGTPDPRVPTMDSEHGRGLYLVAALTSAWGVERTSDGGKLVWAELLRPPAE